MKKLLHDKTFVVEIASAIAFILAAISLSINSQPKADYFWIIIFGIFGVLQLTSLLFKENLVILRICMAWISGSVWSWLTYISFDDAMHATALALGGCNMYAFIVLTNRVTVDWAEYFGERTK